MTSLVILPSRGALSPALGSVVLAAVYEDRAGLARLRVVQTETP